MPTAAGWKATSRDSGPFKTVCVWQRNAALVGATPHNARCASPQLGYAHPIGTAHYGDPSPKRQRHFRPTHHDSVAPCGEPKPQFLCPLGPDCPSGVALCGEPMPQVATPVGASHPQSA